MEDVVAEIIQDLKDQLAEMTSEERREVFSEISDDYCFTCGDTAPCYCGTDDDE